MMREKMFSEQYLQCEVVSMGMDYTILVTGGDTPHVGSVVMAIPRPSLTGQGVGVTSSVINGLGHKDEYISRQFAEAVAKSRNRTVACVCGVHIDNITSEQLLLVKEAADRLLARLLESLDVSDDEGKM